ncbi:TPA: CopG family ribbon-helix-helix protein [Escherichia coli]
MQMKNNSAQATKIITTHVPLPMADKIDQMASRLERSRDWIIKQVLSAWLAQEEERNRLMLEALDDVTSGQAWADSLGTDHPLLEPR